MQIDNIFSISQFGLAYERLRVEAATHNIAIANTPVVDGNSPKALRVTSPASSFASTLSTGVAAGVGTETNQNFRIVNEPGHPLADATGNVRYPDVNVVDEMTTLVSASRAYEANVRAMNVMREMLMKALEIGRQS